MVGQKSPDEMPTFEVRVSGGLEFKTGDLIFRVTVEVPGVIAEDEESAIAVASTAIARQLKARSFNAMHAQITHRKEPSTLFGAVCGATSEGDFDEGFDDGEAPL